MSGAITPAAVLRAARGLIPDEAHWCKGMDFTESGAHCMEYAIELAAGQDGDSIMAIDFVREAIDVDSVCIWQDKPERTFAELQNAFDRAIALAEAKQ